MTIKQIKICHIASADISLRFLLFSKMKYLKGLGYEVWGVSAPGKWIDEIKVAGIKVYTPRITRKMFTPLSDIKSLINLYFFFRREHFDIVHSHTLKASFLGQIAAFLAGVPIRVYTIHGLDFENDFSFLKKSFFIVLEKIIAMLTHVAFSVNREDTEKLIQKHIYPKGKVQYLPMGINLDKFNPDVFSSEFIAAKRKELGIPSSTKVLGIVARLVREKGYFELFEAFSQILKQFPNTLLLVVGPEEPQKSDRFKPEIVREFGIQGKVKFLGERTDIAELYAVMDIFVLPTYREGLGISILEASAMKKPVVATAIRGCREAAEDGKTAILVPPKDSQRLKEALLYLLSHPERGKELGEEGRRKVQREFDEKARFYTLKKEYERLIQEKLK